MPPSPPPARVAEAFSAGIAALALGAGTGWLVLGGALWVRGVDGAAWGPTLALFSALVAAPSAGAWAFARWVRRRHGAPPLRGAGAASWAAFAGGALVAVISGVPG